MDTPIVHTRLHRRLQNEVSEIGYPNPNGPSLIRVPDWLPNPLGNYNLHFAHHKGTYLRNQYYRLAMPGMLYRSKYGLKDFELRTCWLFPTEVRHAGVYREGETLYIFYSHVGDEPERILYSKVDISAENRKDWYAEPPQESLKPELEWEGAKLPISPSMRGAMGAAVHQLRDPEIFQDKDGSLYLLYPGSGAQAIGIAKLEKE